MENYEINVLTRKGGWKKLSQGEESMSIEKEVTLSNEIQDSSGTDLTNSNKILSPRNILNEFQEVNEIIEELQSLEHKKQKLKDKLNELEKKFTIELEKVENKINKINEENDLYKNTINLIRSLKDV